MTSVRDHATAYLAMRRSLGYKLDKHGRLLMEFTGYLEERGHRTITTDAATAWATDPASCTPAYWCQRLPAARCFARYLSAFDPACQIPPPGLLRSATSRPAPYLYSPAEIAALIHAAGTLANPLQAATHQALIGLLAVTGMRIGETVALNADDVDLDAGLVTVRGKYDRTRLLPLHSTTVLMLRQYRQRCRQLCPIPAAPSFFLSVTGTRLTVSRVDAVFAQLLVHAGIGRRRGTLPEGA